MQVVTYSPIEGQEIIKIGHRATVYCIEHTRQDLCNSTVHTSTVQSVSKQGFKTLNTYYKLDNKHEPAKT